MSFSFEIMETTSLRFIALHKRTGTGTRDSERHRTSSQFSRPEPHHRPAAEIISCLLKSPPDPLLINLIRHFVALVGDIFLVYKFVCFPFLPYLCLSTTRSNLLLFFLNLSSVLPYPWYYC